MQCKGSITEIMKHKKSYFDNKKGVYIDTTRNIEYIPKNRCELCGSSARLSVHHYLAQQKCLRDKDTKVVYPSTWTHEFINHNQKLFTLCFQCHAEVEHGNNEKFKQKYGIDRSYFIYEE